MADVDIPQYHQLLWPTLVAMRDLDGSGSIEEIVGEVMRRENFTEQQQERLHKDGPSSEIEYRLAWARTYLKGMGLADNSQRGIWSLTDAGRVAVEPELEPLRQEYIQRTRQRRRSDEPANQPDDAEELGELTWQETLLDALMNMSPGSFERLAQRLLREAGFVSTTVTGRSGDGGIDGLGVYRMSLVSFPVFFQCKRYAGSVGAAAVRDFRGAMTGRGDKGLLITTGSFTADAKSEATRDGAPPLDLIDGARLCELLKQYELGVIIKTRIVEDVEVQPDFFHDL
ncbi:MAG: restriction endonuclease [Austwickia sp.]|nr:restriction endonuclease [Austwickia sp.]MBK8436102.1 restriction endonuclease [Austwickia sp.]MBK9101782.1 restriction endonuclease [Austwickia sp.]